MRIPSGVAFSPLPSTSTSATIAVSSDDTYTPDLVVVVAALVCAVVFTLVLAIITALKNRRMSTSTSTSTDNPHILATLQQIQIEIELLPLVPVKCGLKKSALKALPKMVYEKAADGVEKQAECAICLMEFEEGDEIRKLPQCGHEFHVGCIDKWLRAQPSCPTCRREVVVVPSSMKGNQRGGNGE
ncbi:RING-H2 finger protein ATL80 [Rhynchospora pubera]|uniref:RING-H2 finger protein ATL80 n=1 Tax=Rhynchospora pubera TaxID=906938 RepID=A0AAV8GUA1_9POAL|nr:RING-H2 finger protein ATL80 [Rhynchospora pubera]